MKGRPFISSRDTEAFALCKIDCVYRSHFLYYREEFMNLTTTAYLDNLLKFPNEAGSRLVILQQYHIKICFCLAVIA